MSEGSIGGSPASAAWDASTVGPAASAPPSFATVADWSSVASSPEPLGASCGLFPDSPGPESTPLPLPSLDPHAQPRAAARQPARTDEGRRIMVAGYPGRPHSGAVAEVPEPPGG